MNAKYKKSLKIVTLLITAAFIATASASTYNYLFLNATTAVEGLPPAWEQGTDSTVIYTPAGATCSISNLTGPAGGTKTYSDAVSLTATADTIFNLRIASVTGSTSEMSSIVVRLYDVSSGDSKGNMTVWTGTVVGSDLTGLSIATDETWRFQWEISYAEGATGAVDVQLKVEIPLS
jgi:hypothetical protein